MRGGKLQCTRFEASGSVGHILEDHPHVAGGHQAFQSAKRLRELATGEFQIQWVV